MKKGCQHSAFAGLRRDKSGLALPRISAPLPAPRDPVDLDRAPGPLNLIAKKSRQTNGWERPLPSGYIQTIAAAVAPQIAKFRAGLLTVLALPGRRFDVRDWPGRCPPPCNARLVKGVCPVCHRKIHFAIGVPRSTVARAATWAGFYETEAAA